MNYPDYQPSVATDPLSDDELDALDAQLAELPADGAMNLEALDGFLTGLVVGPGLARTLKGGDWLPLVWGGDGADGVFPFESQRQRKKVVVQVLRHLRTIDVALREHPDAWQPVVSVAEDDAAEEEWVDAGDWCTGFLQSMDLNREAWAPWLDQPALSAQFVPLLLLGGEPEERPAGATQALDDLEVRDQLSRAFFDTVLVLARPEALNG